MNPTMSSVEAELQAVERDFKYGRSWGAFEASADAQSEVNNQLTKMKGLEQQLLKQSQAIWDWNNEEQGLWQQAMHRSSAQQQQGGGNNSTTSSSSQNLNNTTTSNSSGQQQQQQHGPVGADQLAKLFEKRDVALREVSTTVRHMAKAITACGEVVSGGGTNTANADVNEKQQQPSSSSATAASSYQTTTSRTQQQPSSRGTTSSSSSSHHPRRMNPNIDQQQQQQHPTSPGLRTTSSSSSQGGGGGSSSRTNMMTAGGGSTQVPSSSNISATSFGSESTIVG